MGPALLELETDRYRLALAPGVGGSIARLDARDGERWVPLLRGCDAVPGSALESACFPLVPFCNRIRGGRFHFDGREIRLAPNMASDPSPLHGQGWQAPWQLVAQTANAAELRFEHPPGQWPWHYVAHQHIQLGDGLTAEIRCRNMSDRPMPCGLGFHPYFPCAADTRLSTGVRDVWTVDADVLPVERIPARGRYDVSEGRACGRDLDNGYSDWSGIAEIASVALPCTLEMRSRTARFFQLYSPESGELFVAEPVSHANDALGRPECEWEALGIRVLAPGEEMRLDMSLALTGA